MPSIIKIGKYYFNLDNVVNIEIDKTFCNINAVDGDIYAVECTEQEIQEIHDVLDHMSHNTMYWR